jgi:autoinducer 2-degrading protein
MGKKSVIAKLTVKADKVDDFPAAWDDIVAHIDANEPGTEHYVLHQSSTEPTVFYVTEIYADQAALDAHLGSDVFATFGGSLADYVDGGDMQFLEPVKAAKGSA